MNTRPMLGAELGKMTWKTQFLFSLAAFSPFNTRDGTRTCEAVLAIQEWLCLESSNALVHTAG